MDLLHLLLPNRMSRRRMIYLFILQIVSMTMLSFTLREAVAKAMGKSLGFQDMFLFLVSVIIFILISRLFLKQGTKILEPEIAQIRIRLTTLLQQVDFSSYEKLDKATFYNSIVSETQNLSGNSYMLQIFGLVSANRVSCYLHIAWLSGWMGMVLLGVLSCSFLWSYFYLKRTNHLIKTAKQEEWAVFSSVDQLLSGFKQVKLHHDKNDAFFSETIQTSSQNALTLKVKSGSYFSFNYVVIQGILTGMLVTLLLILPIAIPSVAEAVIPVAILLLLVPLDYFLNQIPAITHLNITATNLKEFEHQLSKLAHSPQQPDEEKVNSNGPFSSLELQDLSFHYTDEHGKRGFGIGPLSCKVSAGEILFIAGGNGSGKSTLMKLMTGLYPPFSGRILLNGTPVSLDDHHYLFTPVFTDVHLFDRLYGLSHVSESQVNELLKKMEISESTHYAQGTFSTLDLSTGQKKRLAMVVAMLEDRSVYVFDEWAADQEPEFRDFFYNCLLPEFKAQGKTVIAVTHDDRYFHVADHIIKMEMGEIITDDLPTPPESSKVSPH